MNKLTLDDLYFISLRPGASMQGYKRPLQPEAGHKLHVTCWGATEIPVLQLDSPRRSRVLTSPLSAAEDSWPLSELCTTGRADGLMAMSCTDPEDVSKGSAGALPALSKRPAPSSSSLAVTKGRQNTRGLGCRELQNWNVRHFKMQRQQYVALPTAGFCSWFTFTFKGWWF